MSNEQKIDLAKLTVEELEKVRFLFPEAVDAELSARATYDTDIDLYVDIYKAQNILVPLIGEMKSCPTKRAFLSSGILEVMTKVLNTADKKGRDYKAAYAKIAPATPVEEACTDDEKVTEADATPSCEEKAEETPVATPAVAPVTASVEAPAAFVPTQVGGEGIAVVNPVTSAISMEQIMATAAMMQQQAGEN